MNRPDWNDLLRPVADRLGPAGLQAAGEAILRRDRVLSRDTEVARFHADLRPGRLRHPQRRRQRRAAAMMSPTTPAGDRRPSSTGRAP